jgi:ubiquinone/menaquinone biosynthesis C-methylase UbiE
MALTDDIKKYWEKATPMSFQDEGWSYEEKRKFRYELQDYMDASFRFSEWAGKSVLEIGSGSGIDALEFARNGADVTALDMTENSVNLVKQLAKTTGYKLKVVQSSAVTLPFENKSYDCVYSYGVLHHIPEIDQVMNEVRRVLKDDGTLLAMIYNKDSLLNAYSIVYLHGVKNGLLLNGSHNEKELASRYSERIEGCPYTNLLSKDEANRYFSQWFKKVEVTVRYNVIDTEQQRKVKLGLDDKWELGWHLVIRATGKKK